MLNCSRNFTGGCGDAVARLSLLPLDSPVFQEWLSDAIAKMEQPEFQNVCLCVPDRLLDDMKPVKKLNGIQSEANPCL